MKFTLKTAIIGIAVVILIVIYSGLYTLEEGLQAIVVQFGRPVGEPVTEYEFCADPHHGQRLLSIHQEGDPG